MRQVERSAIVPYPAEAMFDLVADVESYPQFLPGCSAARVHSRDENLLVGSMSLAKGPLKMEFTTRNRLQRPGRMTMELEDGPFSELRGEWAFSSLGEEGCKVSLNLRFAFENRVADLVLGPPFESICNQLIDAFVQRARVVNVRKGPASGAARD